MRKICVITGSRAEYGLLRWLMQGIKDDLDMYLQVIVTGMHLSSEFGLTYKEIEQDGFHIDKKIEILTESDTSIGIAKSIGLGLIGFADALNELNPDLIVVLGDRFEIFSAVSAAHVARIPIAHLHGGEITEGSIDEAFRHSITKMAHLHFVAAETYQRRVMQLGECPDSIFLVGGLGIDSINRLQLLDKKTLENRLNLKFFAKNLLVTFHPVTLEKETSEDQMKELLAALSTLKGTQLIFTLPNADTDSRILIKLIETFTRKHDNARVYSSLGQLLYLSLLAHCDGMVGNSSSGLIEAPSLKKATINIGDRQRGRLQAISVINCEPKRKNIINAFKKLYSIEFQEILKKTKNPYGEGGASEKILKVLKSHPIKNIIKKSFYDLPDTVIKETI